MISSVSGRRRIAAVKFLGQPGHFLLQAELGEGRGVAARQLLDRGPEIALAPEGGDQPRKPAEVAVDQHLVDPGLAGHGVDAERGEPVPGQQRAHRPDKAAAGGLPVPDEIRSLWAARGTGGLLFCHHMVISISPAGDTVKRILPSRSRPGDAPRH